jgi:aminopeptidase YwaD
MKVDNATAAGAAGVVIYNSEPGNFGGGLANSSSIPVASISQQDGRALASGAPATGRLEVRLKEETLTSRNVVAEPAGGSCEIVAGGHFDSVPAGPGANDNASGTAVVLEMARARAARGQADGVCYVLFGSEEIGLVGSGYYVKELAQAELDALKAMLNFDMLAVGDTWPLIGSGEVTDVAVVEAQELGVPYKVSRTLPDNIGSDQASFAQAGVPAMIFNCFCDENYHTAEDKFEHISETRLAEAGVMGLGMIETLLAS